MSTMQDKAVELVKDAKEFFLVVPDGDEDFTFLFLVEHHDRVENFREVFKSFAEMENVNYAEKIRLEE